MTAAFESMRDSPPNVMVISEMLELGVNSKAEHEALIDQINKRSPRRVIGLGTEFHSILKKLNKTIDISAANSITEAVTAFQNSVRDGDSLFVKGSLGSGSWRVCSAVLEELKSQKNLDEGENSHVS